MNIAVVFIAYFGIKETQFHPDSLCVKRTIATEDFFFFFFFDITTYIDNHVVSLKLFPLLEL